MPELSAEEQSQLDTLYDDFAAANLMPLWTQRAGLMPKEPDSPAHAHVWRWNELASVAERAGSLVKVGRGGERRAIALANPGLAGQPSATPNLWAAIQYLGPGETAPSHRHSQSAFRFVLDGEGVWTNVDGDAVAMRRGDLLLTPGWHWHEHQNVTDSPMMWLDGLDIPLVDHLDAGFFEFGPDTLSTTDTPDRSNNERLYAHPGLVPVGASVTPTSPLMAYRWSATDAALQSQLELASENHPGTLKPGHAAIRFSNPLSGGDALRTIRLEMHRLAAGTTTDSAQVVGTAVLQVFDGSGTFSVNGVVQDLGPGDVVAIPSWATVEITASTNLDIFRFSDDPVYEALGLNLPSPRK